MSITLCCLVIITLYCLVSNTLYNVLSHLTYSKKGFVTNAIIYNYKLSFYINNTTENEFESIGEQFYF